MTARTRRESGLSLVEMLIAIVILGILSAALGSFFALNQKVGSEQTTAAKINTDLRLALLRLTDVTSQAHYIFPAQKALTLTGPGFTETLTTGADALAILVPSNTTYCPATHPASYCGFAFVIESSAPYAAILGSSRTATGFALAEYHFTGLDWPEKTLPATTWQDSGALRSPLVDSVNRATSSLAAPGDLVFADYSSYDEDTFSYPTSSDPGYLETFGAQATALVKSVGSRLELSYQLRGKLVSAQRENLAFARAIPRQQQPQ